MGCSQSSVVGRVSGTDLEALDVLFFDCDDTLYQNGWRTAELLKESIEGYAKEELGLGKDKAYELYQEHGTALRGLIKEKLLAEDKVEHFLQKVHNVSLDDIKPRPELREMILKLGHKRRFVFTASTREHAKRCLEIIGIADLFEGIVDCRAVKLTTKHDPMAFVLAMEQANVADPAMCMLMDDSTKNIETAKKLGLVTCLVGSKSRETGEKIDCAYADFVVDNLVELEAKAPALFVKPETAPSKPVGTKRPSQVVAVAVKHEEELPEQPETKVADKAKKEKRMIVVLGGPGSGKGTQCARILRDYPNIEHLSAGDLLREEQARADSKHGKTIQACIKEGQLVPHEITMNLILDAMNRSKHSLFLIDGCPRDNDNKACFEKVIINPGHASLVGVLFYDCTEEIMLERILGRAATSGRADDNTESAKKRFKTFREKTMPVIEHYRSKDLVYEIDGTRSIEDVYKDTNAAVAVIALGTDGRASIRRSMARLSLGK